MVNATKPIEFSLSKKGVDNMRRFMILNFLVLFISSVALFSCGHNSVSETPISQSDTPDLIGTWEGRYNDAGVSRLVRVQILNDSLEGNISFRNPIREGGVPPVSIAFNGKIENGRLAVSWEKDCRMNMKLRKDGKEMKLEGNYQVSQYNGTLTLEKIK
jgi:hypothetical protein